MFSEPFLMGGQPNDPRIVVRESVIVAPGYNFRQNYKNIKYAASFIVSYISTQYC